LAAGGYLQCCIRSHRSPDGGDFPRNIHRLAAVATFSVVSVATARQTVEIFLATPTAWQRWLPLVLYP
jgi:hypothetical protein